MSSLNVSSLSLSSSVFLRDVTKRRSPDHLQPHRVNIFSKRTPQPRTSTPVSTPTGKPRTRARTPGSGPGSRMCKSMLSLVGLGREKGERKTRRPLSEIDTNSADYWNHTANPKVQRIFQDHDDSGIDLSFNSPKSKLPPHTIHHQLFKVNQT